MNKISSLIWTAIVVVSVCFSTGCSRHRGIFGVDCCADIPAGAIPEPAGTKTCDWQTRQAQNAQADQTTLYQSDFVGTSARLSPAAIERIKRHVNAGAGGEFPWVIEPSPDGDLDRKRLQTVVDQLANLGAEPLDVVIGIPPALGLSGPAAERAAAAIGGRGGALSGRSRAGSAGGSGLRTIGNAF